MYRLIEKDYVAVHDGDVLFMDTNPDSSEPHYAGLVKIEGLYGRNCNLYRVNWEGFGRHGSFSMEEYGKEWRLWKVDMSLPTVYDMLEEYRWPERGKRRAV